MLKLLFLLIFINTFINVFSQIRPQKRARQSFEFDNSFAQDIYYQRQLEADKKLNEQQNHFNNCVNYINTLFESSNLIETVEDGYHDVNVQIQEYNICSDKRVKVINSKIVTLIVDNGEHNITGSTLIIKGKSMGIWYIPELNKNLYCTFYFINKIK